MGTADRLAAAMLGLAAALVYWVSPVSQVRDQDPKLELFAAHVLWKHGTLALDPWLPPSERGSWRTTEAAGRTYLYFPLGTQILSVPFAAAVDLLGGRIAADDGSYDVVAETRWQRVWAALLTGWVVALFHGMARVRLGPAGSAGLCLAAAFSTQLWSTASRGLWIDTMSLPLLTLAVAGVWRADLAGAKLRPWWTATLLSWLYFTRPTYCVAILCVVALVAWRDWRAAWRVVAGGALWLAAFVAFSLHVFHAPLPPYFAAGRLDGSVFWHALTGHLASPSRGLLVFVPGTLLVAWMVWRYREWIGAWRWVAAAAVALAAQLAIHSAFRHWWGGGSYGPRYSMGALPWMFAVAVLACDAAQRAWQRGGAGWERPAVLAVATACVLWGTFVHGAGACIQATQDWYDGVDRNGEDRLWSWRHPQFLAAWQERQLPADLPLLDGSLQADDPDAPTLFARGWGHLEHAPDGAYRWSTASRTEMWFGARPGTRGVITLRYAAFIRAPTGRQRVRVLLNGQPVAEWTSTSPRTKVARFEIPTTGLAARNRLVLELPDATAPAAVDPASTDTRLLAVRLHAVSVEPRGAAAP